jgi:membrane complex biogenesis BtpA family protein
MASSSLFTSSRPIVGMIHLLPLPESPAYLGNLDAIYEQAEREAAVLQAAGVDALIVENFGDEPYLPAELSTAQLAVMAGVTRDIIRAVNMPVGVNCQFNAWHSEVAVAHACRADFIRVEVFVDTVIMAQGQVSPCSAQICRYRQQLGAKGVALWADIQTKYTRSLIPQSIERSALDAQAAGADVLIVTGAATGQATPLEVVAQVKQVAGIPVVVGSGTTAANVSEVLRIADGAIVGSALKVGGKAENEVSAEAASAFMAAVRAGRK